MKFEKVVAEAIRVEFNEINGNLYLVFEIKDEELKQKIKKDWTQDIEFKLIGTKLVQKE
jgi:hypothetical protein